MKLLHVGASPFVRKVMMVLELAGQTPVVELIDGMGSPLAPNSDVTTHNPVGKIPCLILDDGQALFDSRVITRYLDSQFGAGLYPDGDAGWKNATLEALCDGMLDAGILCVYEFRCRPEEYRYDEWLEGQRAKISRGLEVLEREWLDHLNGPMTMGHVSTGVLLDYLDFRREFAGLPEWRGKYPGLEKWAAEFLQTPAMQATQPG